MENTNVQDEHTKAVQNGLNVLNKVFNKNNVEYRVLGSVLVASLNGKPHRTLGDIDVLVDETDYEKVISRLRAEDYTTETKHKFGFNWTEAHHDGNLGFTFLLIGKFSKDYFSCKLTRNIELRISTKYLESTKYSLLGTSFIGIPLRSIYEGLKISSLNTKRTLDRKVVNDYLKGSIPLGETLDRSFKVYLSGVEIPHAYTLFSQLYNIYGGIRVLFGRKYEVWD
mgnify:CR=1 FL=1